ncbi:MAG TPA: tRNA (adenosine(37)-N6)-threonylcarbamoyltransferase complex dimerization subunit type 1 TsaB [Jatrophihabitans sp.]|nr:tRNA (adenosine(37)-N6)-threonylcarbamoyltransferase complex dimerization subunit type 1 TsaB [Jatrophihabitans sp.]
MFVLALDTSSPAVTAGIVAVDDSVELVACRAPLNSRGHGELLAPAIHDTLAEAGIAPAQLAAVVAGVGPGPFTGLRVGLVTAAMFAELLRIPAYAVCSLDAVAAAAGSDGELIVATDARRKEVYWARYAPGGARLTGPHVTKPADVDFAGVSAVTGAAVELYGELWPQAPARLPARYPEPVGLVGCALERIRAGAASDPLTPLYLRRPDAALPHAPKAVSQ